MPRTVSTLQRVPLAPVIGAMFGAAAAVLVAATPVWLFEQAVVSWGLATPPPGLTARMLAIVAAFVLVGLVVWVVVRIAERIFAEPVVRDADELDLATYAEAVTVLPPRRPISADRELGAPLMSDAALQTVTTVAEDADHETEADAIDAVPTIPPVPEPPERVERATGYTSIEELIRRLEIGMARRGSRPPDPTGPAAAPPPPASGASWIVRDGEGGEGPSFPTFRATR